MGIQNFSSNTETILVYAKDSEKTLPIRQDLSDEDIERLYSNPDNDKRGPWISKPLWSESNTNQRKELILADGTKRKEKWFISQDRLNLLISENRIYYTSTGGMREKVFPEERPTKNIMNLLLGRDFGTTELATNDLKEIFDDLKIFDYPKPEKLLKFIVKSVAESNSIILDFFAGSATTAHAVLQLNAEDGGKRRHIMVQLPEQLDPSDSEQKAASDFCINKLGKPRTIAELTKERLRRAGKKIREENPLFAGDLGFRVFKLASSNIRAWEPDRDKLAETLEASIEHLKTDRTEQDILFELLLKLGLDLCVPIETRIFYHEKHEAHEKGGDQKVEAMMSLHPQDFRAFRVFRGSPAESPEGSHTVHSIGGGSLLVCLSKFIPQADVEPLALGLVAWHKELKPAGETTVVFRDSAFADDVAKTNLTAILHQHGLETVRSL